MKIRNIPFGYEVVGGRYVVNNGEAEIISSIYSMYLSGKTLLGIAEALTEQEVTYFEDTKVWNKNMVSRILADERYLGNETFPRLVDSNNFNLAKNIRAEKGGKKAVLTPLMATVKDKALFEKQWESIVGNCDELVYLGGNEQSTHKYISEQLGKATIDTNTYGRSDGLRGNFSTNFQLSGRELMTPDEVRMLDNKYCIAFIRGERPVLDYKYDILKHPNAGLSKDGGAPAYQ